MGSVQYKCSQCGHVMNEFHVTCPACGSYYVNQVMGQPVKPYTKISFRRDIVGGCVFMVVAIVGFLIWFPVRTGTVNDSGPIFLLGFGAVIGFAWFISAFDRRANEAKRKKK